MHKTLPKRTTMSSRPIRFLRRGQPVTLHNTPPDRTLLEVLREDLRCTGTKEGCGEGADDARAARGLAARASPSCTTRPSTAASVWPIPLTAWRCGRWKT